MTKCPSCKYENRRQVIHTEEVIRFKSGKRKGEIKEVKPKVITVYEDDPDFIKLRMQKDVDQFVYDAGGDFDVFMQEADLLACPKCGTVIVEQINRGFDK